MIYGIEETSDTRHPETRIERFSSRSAALLWAACPGDRLREIHVMPSGWRAPTKRSVDAMMQERMRNGHPPRSYAHAVASTVRRDGQRILVKP